MTQTIREKYSSMLVENGLFEDEARAVMAQAESDELTESMKGKWDQPLSALPGPALITLWISLRRIAVKWLGKNKPNHWAIPLLKD